MFFLQLSASYVIKYCTALSINKIATDIQCFILRKIWLTQVSTRVKVWSKYNARLAIISVEKNFFHRKAPASLRVECGEFLRFIAVKFVFHLIPYIKNRRTRVWASTSRMSTTSYSTAPSVTYCSDVSCELDISVETYAVNNCKICNFSDEKFVFFSQHSAGSVEKFLSSHSAETAEMFLFLSHSTGSGEKFTFTA